MPLDLFTLMPLVEELNEKLVGARVDKIVQPESDELRLFLRGSGKNSCLVISASPLAPRIHLTESKRENPFVAPAFCMLLRKYLVGAVLESVSIYQNDRAVRLEFSPHNEFFEVGRYYIFVELMNRYSNIIFADGDYIILDAIKHIPLDIEHEKCVLPKLKYTLAVQDKIPFCERNASHDLQLDGSQTIFEAMKRQLSGFAVSTLREILYRAEIPADKKTISQTEAERLSSVLAELSAVRSSALFAPCVSISDKRDFYAFPYATESCEYQRFDTLNDAFDCYYTRVDSGLRAKSRVRELSRVTARLIARLEKAIVLNEEKLAECAQADTYRVWGDLLLCNLYKFKKGDCEVTVDDYCSAQKVSIRLDPLKSPVENANFYYNKYQKLRRAEEHLAKQIEEKTPMLEYARSIADSLATLPLDEPLDDIERELESISDYKKRRTAKREKPSKPFVYDVDGFTVMMGKNNVQNDVLTFKTANSGDLWFHVKNEHGAHAVVFAEGRAIPDNVILIAAEIAASAFQASVSVDYTLRRNVRRKGKYPGLVTYVDYSTLTVIGNRHTELLVK